MSTSLQLKGSLFDVQTIGTVEVAGTTLPEVGDVVELNGKSYTITDLISDDAAVFGQPKDDEELHVSMIAIVEPLAVSQRRGGAR